MPASPTFQARHRGHALSRGLAAAAPRTPGWPNLPFAGKDLLALTQGLVFGAELAKAGPRRLRHMILHMAGRITRGSRQVTLRLQHRGAMAAEGLAHRRLSGGGELGAGSAQRPGHLGLGRAGDQPGGSPGTLA